MAFHRQTTKAQLENALRAAGGNKRRAARALNLSPETLYAKIKEHGIVCGPVRYCWHPNHVAVS